MYIYTRTCVAGVFALSQNSEIYTGDWFWLGGNGAQVVREGREQKKLITGDLESVLE